jgi:dynein heavy chain
MTEELDLMYVAI